ncbi:MAG: hypothetical protein A3G76_01615 [Acidobacteria bacterium RIFCSPLOWO2_12_FULL_65_11]|nr:MAG: hypothetical protein A3H95_03530 [Acidobacteria bacterium RIFCSPLOWO2_02_FULL_64_15]OFW30422.1 MAG: hypothetical protein A3G76_01615 [Acidobacteria bacterium RIFCSPLOWO2_12_FULL_65_11]
MRTRTACLAVSIVVGVVAGVRAEPKPIDTDRSTVTVFAYKSGLFSAFAHDHVISAPIDDGSVSEEAPLSVQVAFRAASLKVLDPTLDVKRRPEVQTRMLGKDVLDAATYPDITFASTAVEAAGADRWKVTGRLTIRGQTRTVTFDTLRQGGQYRGSVLVKQRDFGIEPISIGGGTVKVKDEIKIQFDIAVR